MLTKKGIDGIPLQDCPICKGDGKPIEIYKLKGTLKCPCILHSYICPHMQNVYESKGNLDTLKELMLLNDKKCDCKEMWSRILA